MHIRYTFIWLNPHQPPNSLYPEAVTSCRRRWRPPCPCRPLSMRSWPWGRPGCFKAVYWPLSQLRSTWNNPKDYNLLSWEARFPGTSGPSAFSQCWVILAVFGVARPQNPLSSWGQKTFLGLILDRSDIFLPNILVLVQNCLYKVNQAHVHF